MPSDGPRLARFACLDCKTRKVKCDRLLPTCTRCVKDGEACEYPTMRQRPTHPVAGRPRVHELESRVEELEQKLRDRNGGAAAAERPTNLPQTPESLPESNGGVLVATGRFEPLPPQSQIEDLTNIYFAKVHCNAPMLHPPRYVASLYRPPHLQPPLCLQYAVMALAASTSPTHRAAAEPFYRRARRYIETDELKDDSCQVTVAHAQCWLLLSHFEAQHLWFSRASMSTARAVRLCQVLGLQGLDRGSGVTNPAIPPPRDWGELEERRRTFWVGFVTDRGASSTGGWPVLIDSSRIQTRLPATEEAFQLAILEPTATLDDALSPSGPPVFSSFAHRIVAAHLFHESFDTNHNSKETTTTEEGSVQEEEEQDDPMDEQVFWARFGVLDDGITSAFARLPDDLRCPSHNTYDPDAVLVNLQLHTARICLYRAAAGRERRSRQRQMARGEDPGGPPLHTIAGCLPSAHEVVATAALVADIGARFQNPFVAFAIFMAGLALLKHYEVTGDEGSYARLTGLMNVMVAVAGEIESGATASLAVQLAGEMARSGVDPFAMGRVQGLLERLDLNGGSGGRPLMGKGVNGGDAVLLCPLEARFGPSLGT